MEAAVRLLIASLVISLASFGVGCGSGDIAVAPTAPSQPEPRSAGVWTWAETFSWIALGGAISGRITADDPLCAGASAHHCRYYRLTAPTDGLFEVVITSSAMGTDYLSAPLDLYVVDRSGKGWDPVFGPGPEMRVSLRVKAGSEYQITVWSSVVPGVAFELRASLEVPEA